MSSSTVEPTSARPPRFKLRRVQALLALAAAVCASLPAPPALAQRTWPSVALPGDAQAFSAGEELGVNGTPMRIRGFLSTRPTRDVAEWFRSSLGGTVVESRVGPKHILGQARGDFYVTVQLEQVAGGTRGLVATSDLKTAVEQHEQTQADTQRWLLRLPAGSRILSRIGSQDGARLASQLVYSNGVGEERNGEVLRDVMREEGLRLEREAVGGSEGKAGDDGAPAAGRVLFFKGGGKEATAVISRLPDGRTSVVLNTVTALETLR